MRAGGKYILYIKDMNVTGKNGNTFYCCFIHLDSLTNVAGRAGKVPRAQIIHLYKMAQDILSDMEMNLLINTGHGDMSTESVCDVSGFSHPFT